MRIKRVELTRSPADLRCNGRSSKLQDVEVIWSLKDLESIIIVRICEKRIHVVFEGAKHEGCENLVLRRALLLHLGVPWILNEEHQGILQSLTFFREEPLGSGVVIPVAEIHAAGHHRVAEPEGQARLDLVVLRLGDFSGFKVASRFQKSLREIDANPPAEPVLPCRCHSTALSRRNFPPYEEIERTRCYFLSFRRVAAKSEDASAISSMRFTARFR